MIGAKAITLPLFEFLAPYKSGQPLYLIPERAALLCQAEVIIARDTFTGWEMPVWGTDEYERLKVGAYPSCGPVIVVELSFANELEELLRVVTAVHGDNDVEGDAEEDADDEDADDLEDEDVDEADDDEDLEDDEDDDFDDDWEVVGDDDLDEEDDDEDEEDDEEDDEDDGIGPI